MNIGVILATLYFLKRMAASVEVSPNSAHQINQELGRQGEKEGLPESALVFALEGPFSSVQLKILSVL